MFLIAYTLRAIYSVGFGGYYDVVCQIEYRWIIDGFLRFFFSYTAIVSMLYFHHQSFRDQPSFEADEDVEVDIKIEASSDDKDELEEELYTMDNDF